MREKQKQSATHEERLIKAGARGRILQEKQDQSGTHSRRIAEVQNMDETYSKEMALKV